MGDEWVYDANAVMRNWEEMVREHLKEYKDREKGDEPARLLALDFRSPLSCMVEYEGSNGNTYRAFTEWEDEGKDTWMRGILRFYLNRWWEYSEYLEFKQRWKEWIMEFLGGFYEEEKEILKGAEPVEDNPIKVDVHGTQYVGKDGGIYRFKVESYGGRYEPPGEDVFLYKLVDGKWVNIEDILISNKGEEKSDNEMEV